MTLAELSTPAPIATALSRHFWRGLADGQLMLQRCGDCGRWVFYPREICPHCWSPNLAWLRASGQGRLATWSVIHRAGHPGWQPATPYVVGIVRLAEGPAMLSLILAPVAALRAALPVRMAVTDVGGNQLPCFEPAA